MAHPTKPQRNYLKHVANGHVRVDRGYLNGAPSGVNMRTHGICEAAGWTITAKGPWDGEKAVALTEAGRAALSNPKTGG